MKKVKLTSKQKKQMKKRKLSKQIDSNNLRAIIKAKKEWAIAEIKRGKIQQQNIQNTITQLEGIIAFVNDLTEPIDKEKRK